MAESAHAGRLRTYVDLRTAPTLVELPYLHAPTPPMLGTTWSLQLFAPDAGWETFK